MTTSATVKITACDTCGEHFIASTMHHLDTAPECGDCRNDRLREYIACGWATPDESSEPCDHPEARFIPISGSPIEVYACPDCDTDLTDTIR